MNHSSTPLLRRSIWESPVEVLSMERVVEAEEELAMSQGRGGDIETVWD